MKKLILAILLVLFVCEPVWAARQHFTVMNGRAGAAASISGVSVGATDRLTCMSGTTIEWFYAVLSGTSEIWPLAGGGITGFKLSDVVAKTYYIGDSYTSFSDSEVLQWKSLASGATTTPRASNAELTAHTTEAAIRATGFAVASETTAFVNGQITSVHSQVTSYVAGEISSVHSQVTAYVGTQVQSVHSQVTSYVNAQIASTHSQVSSYVLAQVGALSNSLGTSPWAKSSELTAHTTEAAIRASGFAIASETTAYVVDRISGTSAYFLQCSIAMPHNLIDSGTTPVRVLLIQPSQYPSGVTVVEIGAEVTSGNTTYSLPVQVWQNRSYESLLGTIDCASGTSDVRTGVTVVGVGKSVMISPPSTAAYMIHFWMRFFGR